MNFSPNFLSKLSEYENFVLETNQIHNLISPSTEKDIRNRHSLDSLEIIKYFPDFKKDNNIICDLGSGAGFPAVTTALYFKYEKPVAGLKVIAYESIGKKCKFLEECKNRLGLDNFEVRNARIESEKNIKADFITARAFSALENIFTVSKGFLKPDTKFILHKGAKAEEEIKTAKQKFNFYYKIEKNSTSEGVILLAENVK